MIVRYASYILICYVALCLLVFLLQRRLLYLPTQHTSPEKAALFGMIPWTPSGDSYLGFLGGQTDASAKGTILVFHGNAGSAIDRFYYVDALGQLGFRVIIAEYPGYGARPGNPSQTALVNHADHLIQQIAQTFPGPLYLWGESLGAGVAAAATHHTSTPIDGLVLLTPWYSLPELAQSIYWFLPAKWLVKDRFENAHNLADYQGPVAVLLAQRDQIIPIRHGEKLYQSLETRKQRWLFENAGHNTWPSHSGEVWWSEVMSFLSQEMRPDLGEGTPH